MISRCPAAQPVRPLVLPDWRLRFEAVATMEAMPGASLPAALYRLTPDCEHTLDRVEGVDEGRYRRATIPVSEPGGDMVPALTYIKIDSRRGPPTPAYLDHVTRGYADWGHDTRLLAAAVRDSLPAASPTVPSGPGRDIPAGVPR